MANIDNDIVEEHREGLRCYAARILGDVESSHDIVQDAFLRLLKHNHKGGAEVKNVSAWLYKTTRNLCYDKCKSAGNRLEVALEDGQLEIVANRSEEPDKALAAKEEKILLKEAINSLDPRSREIVILKIEHERSYKEIADVMDMTTTNVGFILHKAMKKLMESLGKEESMTGGNCDGENGRA
ncbi:MAG: RNA polymerase sigma factor [Victivallales bacterium]|nr:RNA polymerase sigma factor [Victivallales bacterium]